MFQSIREMLSIIESINLDVKCETLYVPTLTPYIYLKEEKIM